MIDLTELFGMFVLVGWMLFDVYYNLKSPDLQKTRAFKRPFIASFMRLRQRKQRRLSVFGL